MERRFYESLLIVAIGLLLHVNDWHMVKLMHADETCIDVNNASALFTVSMIFLLAMYRPHNAVASMSRVMRLVVLIAESLLVLYATELLLLQTWQPLLKVLAIGCHFHSHLLQKAGFDYYWPAFTIWLRNDAYFFLRFFCSSLVFVYMLEVSGWLHIMMAILRQYSAHCCWYQCAKRMYSFVMQPDDDADVVVDPERLARIENVVDGEKCDLCCRRNYNGNSGRSRKSGNRGNVNTNSESDGLGTGPSGNRRENNKSNSSQHIDSRQCRKNRMRTGKTKRHFNSSTCIEQVTQDTSTC